MVMMREFVNAQRDAEAVPVSQQNSNDTCLAYPLAAMHKFWSAVSISHATNIMGSIFSTGSCTSLGTSLAAQQELLVLLKRPLNRAEGFKLIHHLTTFKGDIEAVYAQNLAEEKFVSISRSPILMLQLQLLHTCALHKGQLKVTTSLCGELELMASSTSGVDMELKVECRLRLARTLFAAKKYSQAADVAQSLFSTCYKTNMQITTATVLLLLSAIYMKSGNPVLALPFASASLHFCKLFNLDILEASVTLLLAELWLLFGSQHAQRTFDIIYQKLAMILGYPEGPWVSVEIYSNGSSNELGYIWKCRTVCIWSLPNLILVITLNGHKRDNWSVEFSSVDKCVITSSGDRTVKIWEMSGSACLKAFEGHTSSVLQASFLTRGPQFISCGADDLVKLCNVKANECVATYDQHAVKVWALAVGKSTDTLATGGRDAVVNLWYDSTAADKEEAFRKAKEGVLKGQELENAALDADYNNAIQLAFELCRPTSFMSYWQHYVE